MSRYQTEQQLTKEQLNAIEKIMFSDFKLPQRFWDRTKKVGDCLLWTGSLNANGYGQFTIFGKNNRAHRLSYMEKNGPIDIDMVIDHTCVNASCVNPEHLEMVTAIENEIRKSNRIYEKKTFEERARYRTIFFRGEHIRVLESLEVSPYVRTKMYFEFHENLCRQGFIDVRGEYRNNTCWRKHTLYTKMTDHISNRYSDTWYETGQETDYSVCPHGKKIKMGFDRMLDQREARGEEVLRVGVWTRDGIVGRTIK